MSDVTQHAWENDWRSIAYKDGVTRCNADVTLCPCCGHPKASEDFVAQLGPIQRRIYEVIRDAGTMGIHRERLEHLVYGGRPDGGPTTDSIKVMLCRVINPPLKAQGLVIKSRNWIYRLQEIAP